MQSDILIKKIEVKIYKSHEGKEIPLAEMPSAYLINAMLKAYDDRNDLVVDELRKELNRRLGNPKE